MRRVFLIILDSLGVGALPDAASFGDAGTHTLDHIVEATGGLDVPNLSALGLGNIAGVRKVARAAEPRGAFGRCAELSPGKDTSTGHWEMMGCVLKEQFPVFPFGFPPEIVNPFVGRAKLRGVLCNEAASGTEVIERFGAEHIASGKPIVYTSADSVFQIACHEQHFGLERLYAISSIAREILDAHGVGRVIARPFVGAPGSFQRTYNRRDYSLEPFTPTSLNRLQSAGVHTIGVGKIEDIFAGSGVAESIHTEGNRDGMRKVIDLVRRDHDRCFVFVNLVDFDMLYGHRRDARGYRRALEEFDADFAEFSTYLRDDDLVLISADHGNDPTFTATTDHTREYIPVLAAGNYVKPGVDLGTRASFADIGATVEEALGLAPGGPGRSFLREITAD
jgi:phosphopentomutase